MGVRSLHLRVVFLVFALASFARAEQIPIFWPTPSSAFFEGASWAEIVQPTASGRVESALFGCVRNGGNRFHEGLDLKPIGRDRRNEATDGIFAVMPGRVAHISELAGNSSYGRYVVVVHESADVPVYTLYAHLASIENGLRVGQLVPAGGRLGTMGRSAGGYTIPRQRAHLHFELGLVKSTQFDRWYRQSGFTGKNLHGNYNGINLMGADPVHFWETVRAGQFDDFQTYFHGLPTAFTLRIGTKTVPEIITRYPHLLTKPVPKEGVAGWDIEYTWYGLPKKWTPLGSDAFPYGAKEGDIALVSFKPEEFRGQCRDTLTFSEADPQGTVKLGLTLTNDLKMFFGFR